VKLKLDIKQKRQKRQLRAILSSLLLFLSPLYQIIDVSNFHDSSPTTRSFFISVTFLNRVFCCCLWGCFHYSSGCLWIFLERKRRDSRQKHTGFVPTLSFFFLFTFLVSNYWRESLQGCYTELGILIHLIINTQFIAFFVRKKDYRFIYSSNSNDWFDYVFALTPPRLNMFNLMKCLSN